MEYYVQKTWYISAENMEEAEAVSVGCIGKPAHVLIGEVVHFRNAYEAAFEYLDIKPDELLVDLGAGDGGFAEYVRFRDPKLKFHYIAVENEIRALSLLKKFGYRTRVADLSDKDSLLALDLLYDKCLCIVEAVQHFTKKQQMDLVEWVKSHSRQGAVFFGISKTVHRELVPTHLFEEFCEVIGQFMGIDVIDVDGYFCVGSKHV